MTNRNIYKNIYENIATPIIICDSALKIMLANNAACELFNAKKENLLGKILSDLILLPQEGCPICKGNISSKFLPEDYEHTAEIKINDNEIISVSVKHKLIEEDIYICQFILLNDCSKLNQAHIDFVSTVSHELRTPLTSIKGFADTLLTAGDRLDKEQQKRFITIIKTQIDRLTRLVEDLLTVSRLEAKKDNSIYKAIHLNEFIDIIIQTISPKAQEHYIDKNIIPNLPPVWTDSDKLEQILTNLVDNAIKYSPKQTKVTINANYEPENPDYIQIQIIDQGIGIKEEHLPKIFTKFSRLDNPLTRQIDGTGLGLYITKSLVESMNGIINVESDGNGSTFVVKLPVATPELQISKKFSEKD